MALRTQSTQHVPITAGLFNTSQELPSTACCGICHGVCYKAEFEISQFWVHHHAATYRARTWAAKQAAGINFGANLPRTTTMKGGAVRDLEYRAYKHLPQARLWECVLATMDHQLCLESHTRCRVLTVHKPPNNLCAPRSSTQNLAHPLPLPPWFPLDSTGCLLAKHHD